MQTRKPGSRVSMRNEHLILIAAVLLSVAPNCAAQEECAGCHRKQAEVHSPTPMRHAMETAEQCGILRANPKLAFRDGAYSYQIVQEGNRSIYTVTDGKTAITAPIDWAFGLGKAGQTYVFQRNGVFYESRVSYYQAIAGLDLTLGARNTQPKDIDDAAGRAMDAQGTSECFGCHSTNGIFQRKLHIDPMIPGIQCGRCHESAQLHAQAAKAGDTRSSPMKKLFQLTTEETSDFCGQCHRTWAQIAAGGPSGIGNVRFQPYRLANSKCYDATDSRISCVACHDPHQAVIATPQPYTAKCQACHSTAAKSKICPVATGDCATCHMPKYDLPGTHFRFTDHQIRIVKAGAPYPN